ncbi:MAG: hypothetical protein AAF737_09800, partial [Pseudomonadota bacterium]
MRTILIAVCIALLGAAGLALALSQTSESQLSETKAFTVPEMVPMTVADARKDFWRLTPALLLVVYDAFGQTQEDAIYDTLELVTHGDALEFLYLERVGAMASDGLDGPDQTLHEIKLLNSKAQADGANLSIDASWQVIGTVGHAEHMH